MSIIKGVFVEKKLVRLILIFLFFTFSILSFFLDFKHDYPQYIEQWQNLINGENIYQNNEGQFKMFGYGPFHHIFSFFYSFNSNLPRILFSLFWFIGCYQLFNLIVEKNNKIELKHMIVFLVLTILNPYVLRLFYYGSNDIFVSSLLFLGVLSFYKKNWKIAALFLVIAFNYKLYPIVIFPFLIFNKIDKISISNLKLKKVINLNFTFWLLLFLSIGFTLQYMKFGKFGLMSYYHVLDRGATSSSLFYFITKTLNTPIHNSASLIIGFMGLLSTFIFYALGVFKRYDSIIIAIIILFMTSRVFYFAYEISFFLLVPFVYFLNKKEKRKIKIEYFFYSMLMIFIFKILVESYFQINLKNYKGLLYLVPNLVLMYLLIKSSFYNKKTIKI